MATRKHGTSMCSVGQGTLEKLEDQEIEDRSGLLKAGFVEPYGFGV